TAASAAVAIAMAIGKSAAADSQNNTAMQVLGAGLRCDPPGPANPNQTLTPMQANALPSACSSYDSDVANQNTDATVGNIAIGVGVAALAGTVIYWLVADKSDSSPQRAQSPTVVPLVGASTNGGSLSLAGHF
ncbi:MAG: hypothetical protein ACRENE_16050, partial [Polyangiaceae bacterium]